MIKMRLFLIVGVVSLALAAPAWAAAPGLELNRKRSSGAIAAQKLVKSTKGAHVGTVTLKCATAPCEVVLYDSNSIDSTTTVVYEASVAVDNDSFSENVNLLTDKGLYVEVTGSGTAFVTYE